MRTLDCAGIGPDDSFGARVIVIAKDKVIYVAIATRLVQVAGGGTVLHDKRMSLSFSPFSKTPINSFFCIAYPMRAISREGLRLPSTTSSPKALCLVFASES